MHCLLSLSRSDAHPYRIATLAPLATEAVTASSLNSAYLNSYLKEVECCELSHLFRTAFALSHCLEDDIHIDYSVGDVLQVAGLYSSFKITWWVGKLPRHKLCQ